MASPSLSPAPGSTLDTIDQITDSELRPGTILYDPPAEMRVGEVERIEVRITRRLSDELIKGLKGKGEKRVEELLVGAFMEVELKSDAFEVTMIGSPVKSLLSTGYTEWLWDVKPVSSGDQTLSIVAKVVYQGQVLKEGVLKEKVFDRPVHVAVNPTYSTWKWLASNWDKLVAALGITGAGIFGVLYRRLRRRMNEERNVSAGGDDL